MIASGHYGFSAMRDAFFSAMFDLMSSDERVVFLTGDLGYKLFNPLRKIAPERTINFGIREAAMVGFASGLARSGMLPFVYSIAPFITLRCLEQIKIDLCYNRSKVILAGVGGGFSYGPNGPTHHGVDDLGTLSCLPGLQVWVPADPLEVRSCLRKVSSLDGPAYLRLGRNGEPNIHGAIPNIDNPMVLREGNDGVLIACGVILHEAFKACELLAADGIRPRVIHVPILRPFPRDFMMSALLRGAPVMTVEEHVPVGGLGQEMATCLAESGMGSRFRMLSIPSAFPGRCMSRKALLKWAGIDAAAIARKFKVLMTGA